MKIFATINNFDVFDPKPHIYLEKGGVKFEMTSDEYSELKEVLKGNRNIAHEPLDGNYVPDTIYVWNDKECDTPQD